jgi:predicted exporter
MKVQTSIRMLSWGLICTLLVFSLFQLFHFRQEMDITKFIPSDGDREQLIMSRMFRGTTLSQSMIVLLTPQGKNTDLIWEFSDRFSDRLKKTGLFDRVKNGVQVEQRGNSIYKTYFPFRFLMASSHPRKEIETWCSEDGLDQAGIDLFIRIKSAMGSASKYLASDDPLLLFERIVKRQVKYGSRISPKVVQGRFGVSDGTGAILLLRPVNDAFDTTRQREIIARLKSEFQLLNESYDSQFSMDFTGVNRFALDGERLIKADIQRVFFLSVVGLCLLFLTGYRDIRPILIIALPVFFGICCAVGLSTMLFGSIHGLALAFGATLTGICIDYPVHILNHLRCRGEHTKQTVWLISPQLIKSLAMGMGTTAAGLAVIAMSSFPGIRQIAVFTSIGVVSAFLFSLTVTPFMVVRMQNDNSRLPGKGPWFIRLHTIVISNRKWCLVTVAVITVVSICIIPEIHFYTDMKSMNSTDPETVAADNKIRATLPVSKLPLICMVSGHTVEDVLKRNDELFVKLEQLESEGRIQSFFSIHPYLFSEHLQNRNREGFLRAETRLTMFPHKLEKQGFKPGQFAGFTGSLASLKELRPMNADDVASTTFQEILQNFILYHDDKIHVVSLVAPLDSDPLLLNAIDDGNELIRFRQADLLNRMITASQQEAFMLMSYGTVLIVVILGIYQRRFSAVLTSVFPAAGSIVITLGILGFCGITINMMHVISLLLVLCIGVDYGIFITDNLKTEMQRGDLQVAGLSVLISAASTCIAFGVLIFATNPALKSIGLTVSIGVPISCALAFVFNLELLRMKPTERKLS